MRPPDPGPSSQTVSSSGDFVFAKTGQWPFWPARLLSVNRAKGKCQVFLYGLDIPVDARIHNIVKITDETREQYGKEKRRGSQYRDAFANALFELDSNPGKADYLLDIARGIHTGSGSQDTPGNHQSPTDEPVQPFELLNQVPTISHVPKASRVQCGKAYTG